MKYYGMLGFAEEVEVRQGVYRSGIVEYPYAGDYNRVSQSFQSRNDSVNDNLTTHGEISIVADRHAFQNMNQIRYATWRGTKWKITSIDDSKHPRLILTIGGEWNDNRGSQA